MKFLRGLCRGVATEKRGQNQEYTFHYLVVEEPGFQITKLQLPDVLASEDMRKRFQALEGKQIDAEFELRVYKSRNGDPQLALNYAGAELPQVHQLKAA